MISRKLKQRWLWNQKETTKREGAVDGERATESTGVWIGGRKERLLMSKTKGAVVCVFVYISLKYLNLWRTRFQDQLLGIFSTCRSVKRL